MKLKFLMRLFSCNKKKLEKEDLYEFLVDIGTMSREEYAQLVDETFSYDPNGKLGFEEFKMFYEANAEKFDLPLRDWLEENLLESLDISTMKQTITERKKVRILFR